MIQKERCIVIDLDGTLCPLKRREESYADLEPVAPVLARLREYRAQGFYVILYTARNMQTHDGNLGRINADTAKFTLAWLDRHQVPYDEIHFGKPWPGKGGFYVDDRTIRPDEFVSLPYEDVLARLGRE